MGTQRILKPGDILQWDIQADVWCGEYKLVKDLGNNRWEIEILPPSDELLDTILADTNPYCGGEREALRRIEDSGRRMTIRLVSSEEYARYF